MFKFTSVVKHSPRLKTGAKFIVSRCEGCLSSGIKLVESDQPYVYRLQKPEQYPFTLAAVVDWDSVRYAPKQFALLKTWYIIRQYIDKMSQISSSIPPDMTIKPPECVRGMKTLDRSAFNKTILVPSLLVPFKNIGKVTEKFRGSLFRQPCIKPVADIKAGENEKEGKLLLFNPKKCKTVDSFSDNEKQLLEANGVELSTWKLCEVDLTYLNWTYQEVLDAILPQESEGVATYSTIGHIVHLNLKDSLLEFKQIIGEVLLDKVPTAETVVNKTSAIDNTFRNFKMEVLAGKDDFMATIKEHGLTYQMDFSKVYWNPRLGTEHQRIVNVLKRDDVVYDVFAGIGPFAVPASKKQCIVFANDLNPESYKWLKHNMELNKVKLPAKLYNMDGRDFIRHVIKGDLLERWKVEKDRNYRIHMLMNLPALAVEFLDTLPGLMAEVDKTGLKSMELPRVHCYCFSKGEDSHKDVKTRAEQALHAKLPEDHDVRFVRNVAPYKDMFCLSFVIPEDMLFQSTSCEDVKEQQLQEEIKQPETKKCRLDESC